MERTASRRAGAHLAAAAGFLLVAAALAAQPVFGQDEAPAGGSVAQWYAAYLERTDALHAECEASLEGVRSETYSGRCARFLGAADILFGLAAGVRSGYGMGLGVEDVLGIPEADMERQVAAVRARAEALMADYAEYRGDFPVE